MNPILQNEAFVFPQQPVIDATVVTNQSGQSESCVAQRPRDPLTGFNDEGNQSVEPNGKQMEHEYSRNLDATGRHETTEITTFHVQMDRNPITKDKNSIIGQSVTEIT